MGEPLKVIIGILSFAVVTSIIYAWGIKKTINQQKELSNMLYSKGAQRVIKKLKNQKVMTKSEIEEEIKEIKISAPFSRKKAIVADKKEFTKTLVQLMIKKGLMRETIEGNKRVYTLT